MDPIGSFTYGDDTRTVSLSHSAYQGPTTEIGQPPDFRQDLFIAISRVGQEIYDYKNKFGILLPEDWKRDLQNLETWITDARGYHLGRQPPSLHTIPPLTTESGQPPDFRRDLFIAILRVGQEIYDYKNKFSILLPKDRKRDL